MQHLRNVLLAFSLLTGCAAAEPGTSQTNIGQSAPDPQFGQYLAGRFAASQSDIEEAAKDLLLASAATPDDDELLTQTFLACLMAGRPDALRLAQKLPDNPGRTIAPRH